MWGYIITADRNHWYDHQLEMKYKISRDSGGLKLSSCCSIGRLLFLFYLKWHKPKFAVEVLLPTGPGSILASIDIGMCLLTT